MPSSTINSSATGHAFTSRFRSIDLLRGGAVAGMILTHASDAFLSDQFRHNDLWYAVNTLFGFVAPAFLFAAGLTLWIALKRRESKEQKGNRGLFRRGVTILLIGYWLQIPILSLRQLIWNHRPDELARLFDANVLQVIALTMMAILLLAHLLQSIDRARYAALVLGICIALATAYVWSGAIYNSLPLPLGAYLAPQPTASFPLVPYSAYLLFGFAGAPVLLERERTRWGALMLLAGGIALLGGGLLGDLALRNLPPYDNFWGSSVQHVLFRLGGVIIALALCMAVERTSRDRKGRSDREPASRTWLERTGENSLAIYVLHLMLIYGSPVTMGMRWWLGGVLNNALSPIPVLLIGATVTLLSGEIAQGWKWMGKMYPRTRLWIKRGWWGIFWAIFLLKP